MNNATSIIGDLKAGDIIIDAYWEGVYRKWGWKNPTERAKLRVIAINADYVTVCALQNKYERSVISNPTSDYYRKEVAE